MKHWTVSDALETYNVRRWGERYFGINDRGNLVVYPTGTRSQAIDLKELADDIQRRGIGLPLLIRFSDILRSRVEELNETFRQAIKEFDYQGTYKGVYPIKVNQQRHVVEEILAYGKKYDFGLEAGSKPELMAVIALMDNEQGLIVCNGYKDEEYIETALLACKLRKTVILVVEKFSELEVIERVSKRLGIRPHIGIRVRLSTRGAGRWESSGGDRSKFGLSASELLQAIEFLRTKNLLSCFELLHFHLGSQISDIRSIKNALKEACRFYTESARLGANLQYMDVGGGLGVDYDGSQTNFSSSINYTLQEYANDVVFAVGEACDHAGQPHPTIVSESGRAVTAHHSVLIFNVLGVSDFGTEDIGPAPVEEDHKVLHDLYETYQAVSRKNFQEAYHDALQFKDECLQLFSLGYLSLEVRARAEHLFWAICRKLLKIVRGEKYVPDELEGLEKELSDTYFCNVSFFQSVPDAWAVDQLFPVMPIHRLGEEPTHRATLADITCDSDGKLDKFIDLRDVKSTLELHTPNGQDYVLGVFLVGAYQEILGDLHNLFGDTNAVHVSFDPDGEHYRVEHVVEGDTVEESLRYVQFTKAELVSRLRRTVEECVRSKDITLEESAAVLKAYEQGLSGYTYLEG
jgi:arginine decarboxylase